MSDQSRADVDGRSMLNDAAVAIDALTPEEAWDVFDRAVRNDLHMSGKEFLRRWDAGVFRADPDRPGVMDVAQWRDGRLPGKSGSGTP